MLEKVAILLATKNLLQRWQAFLDVLVCQTLRMAVRDRQAPGILKSCSTVQAVRAMHEPQDMDWQEVARNRLAFEELFLLQLKLLLQREILRWASLPCSALLRLHPR